MVWLHVQGRSPDPDQVAFREPVTRQPLHRVRFAQADVWPEYASGSQDTIDIEIHQPWLEAATEEDLSKQQVWWQPCNSMAFSAITRPPCHASMTPLQAEGGHA